MIGSSIVTEITDMLGKRTDIETKTLRGLELARLFLEQGTFLPWFLVTTIADTTMTIDDERVEVPSDFIRELDEMGDLWVEGTDGKKTPLKKRDYDVLRNSDYATESAIPKYYALTGDYFRCFPIPDVAYPMTMLYYAHDTDVANDGVETAWGKNAPGLLIAWGGYYTARGLRAQEAMKLFQEMIPVETTALQIADEARRQANLEMWMGMYDNANEAF
jgi:hypothetical protein